MTRTKFQFVLQWPAASVDDYDEMTSFEDAVVAALGDVGHVDGHDAGAGQMNIFVHTDDPLRAFERIKSLPRPVRLPAGLKVAYRAFDGDSYEVLYAQGLTSFVVP